VIDAMSSMRILAECAKRSWRYNQPTAVLTDPMDWEGALLVVVGDPVVESYEWVYITEKVQIIESSNHGYRSTQAAFRDGLVSRIHPRS
jgi:hypothetical protein